MIVLEWIVAHLVAFFWLQNRSLPKKSVKGFVFYCIPHLLLYLLLLFAHQKVNGSFIFLAVVLSVLHAIIDLCSLNKDGVLRKWYLKYGSFRLLVVQILHILAICLLAKEANLYSIHWSQTINDVIDFVLGKFNSNNVEVKFDLSVIIVVFLTHGCSMFIKSLLHDDLAMKKEKEIQSSQSHVPNSTQTALEVAAGSAEEEEKNYSAIEKRFREKFNQFDTNLEVSETVENKQKDDAKDGVEITRKITVTYNKFDESSTGFSDYIGIMERIIIAILVLKSAITGITFLVTLKALSRYKQFDDKVFAQFFLVGTLCSAMFGLIGGYLLLCVWQ